MTVAAACTNYPQMIRFLLSILLAALTLATSAEASEERDGRMVLVARESVSDTTLRAQLAAIGGPGATRYTIALTTASELPGVDRCISRESLEDANDRDLSRMIRSADVLVLRGGSFMGWYDTVFHKRDRTLLFDALLDRIRTRKTLIAYGAAAAFLSGGVTIPRSELDKQPRNPRYAQSQVPRAALPLGPPALIGSDDFPEGSPLRWLHSLWQTRMTLGLYLVGDVGLDYRSESLELHILGPGTVIACDLGNSRRMKRRLEGARLSLLYSGDGWDFGNKRALVHEESALAPPPRSSHSVAGSVLGSASELLAILGDSTDPAEPKRTPNSIRFELSHDSGSATWKRDGEDRKTLLALPMRLEWDEPLFPPAKGTPAPR